MSILFVKVLDLGLRLWQTKIQVDPPPSVTTRRSYLDGNDGSDRFSFYMKVLDLGLRLWQMKIQVDPPPSVLTRR